MIVRRLLALLVVFVALVGCSPSSGSSSPSSRPSTEGPAVGVEQDDPVATATAAPGVHCGYVRWKVKTGQDALASQVNLKAVPSSIAALRGLTAPFAASTGKYPPNYRRFPSEEQTVRIRGYLVAYAKQQDDDDHLVIATSKSPAAPTIIAEIPAPECVGSSPWAAKIKAARAAFVAATGYDPPEPRPGTYSPGFVRADRAVTITGVVFFDFVHGQHGVAPNGVEIHPILSITFARHRSPSPTPSPSG